MPPVDCFTTIEEITLTDSFTVFGTLFIDDGSGPKYDFNSLSMEVWCYSLGVRKFFAIEDEVVDTLRPSRIDVDSSYGDSVLFILANHFVELCILFQVSVEPYYMRMCPLSVGRSAIRSFSYPNDCEKQE